MMSRRSGVGLAVVNGQLYAVGGFDGTTYLKTIEVFDQVNLCYLKYPYLFFEQVNHLKNRINLVVLLVKFQF